MALKDWKKVKKDEWRKQYMTASSNEYYKYIKIQKNNSIRIYIEPITQRFGRGYTEVKKQFRTKPQALKFARAYMRKR